LAGYFLAESGVGEHARTMLATLDSAGIPVAPVLFGETRSRQLASLSGLDRIEPDFPVSLICVNADQTPLFFGRHPELRRGRYTIGYWHWEVEEFPDRMAESASLVDEIWTASEHSRQAIARKVDRPVRVVNPAVDPPPAGALPPDLLPQGDGPLLLTCFDYDSVLARKNPLGAIAAFERAFPRPGTGARLLVKSINGEMHAEARAHLHAQVPERPDIHVVDRYLDRSQQARLIESCDIFLSLHRAEGFGLMLAEAMLAGKTVVATCYSGNLEFMTADTSLLVPWSYQAIPDGSGPYTGRWAEPDLDAATEAILRATGSAALRRELGGAAAQAIRARLSIPIRAQANADSIREVLRGRGATSEKARGSFRDLAWTWRTRRRALRATARRRTGRLETNASLAEREPGPM